MEKQTNESARQKFINAINTAAFYSKENFKKTKTAYWSERFFETNKPVIKAHEKELNKIKQAAEKEIGLISINLAEEKEGKLVRDGKDAYAYSKENRKKLLEKTFEINEKLNQDIIDFMDTTIAFQHFDLLTSYPDDLPMNIKKDLDGFVIKVKNEFDEQVKEEKIKGNLLENE